MQKKKWYIVHRRSIVLKKKKIIITSWDVKCSLVAEWIQSEVEQCELGGVLLPEHAVDDATETVAADGIVG